MGINAETRILIQDEISPDIPEGPLVPALCHGTRQGRLFRVMSFTLDGGKVARVEIIADPGRLRDLDIAILES